MRKRQRGTVTVLTEGKLKVGVQLKAQITACLALTQTAGSVSLSLGRGVKAALPQWVMWDARPDKVEDREVEHASRTGRAEGGKERVHVDQQGVDGHMARWLVDEVQNTQVNW